MNENSGLPKLRESKFQCLHCGVLAQQHWSSVRTFTMLVEDFLSNIFLTYRENVNSYEQKIIKKYNDYAKQQIPAALITNFLSGKFNFSQCQSCNDTTVWLDRKIIYPTVSPVSEPNEDLDDKIKELYREARNVHPFSTRAAAALLRLCVEKLCTQVGVTGTLNEKIKKLVKKGLTTEIQQAFDYCRIIGNQAVHLGEIDIEEDPKIVLMLFDLVNDIAQELITKPKEMQEKYAALPQGQINQIKRRDDRQ